MTPVRTIGPDNSFIDYFNGEYASRRGLTNYFGIRVEEGQCCAVVKIGDARPFRFGKYYSLPMKIDTLPNPLRNTVDDHLLNCPSSDLLEVLAGKKSFQEAVNSSTDIKPKRMTATGKVRA